MAPKMETRGSREKKSLDDVIFEFKYALVCKKFIINEYLVLWAVTGCLLDNSAPRGPPDVPPRNPTMSRVNGRLPGSHAASDHERDPDLQPSCLVRTSSGGFYSIPSEY